MGIAVPIEDSGRQHHQKPTMKAFAATTGASPTADPALIYSGLGGVVAPVVGTVDTGLKFHPESGAVTPDFTEAQKEAAPELAANQKDIKHLAYTGHVVQPVFPSVVHTGYHLYGKREAEAEADPALVYTTGHTVVPHVVAPAVYTHSGLVAHPNGAVTPDYTPAQKVAAATHLAAKVHTPVYSGIYSPYIHYGKREAEAEPAADAQADSWGYGYGLPYAYGGVYSPYIHYGKRDADAKSDAWGYGLGGVYGYPHVYGGVHGGYPYHYGKRDADAINNGAIKNNGSSVGGSASFGHGSGSGSGHGGVYRPFGHIGKRDAEAKSDAWGYGLGGLYGSPHVYGGVYGGYPYHYGKRDAEAKSDAYFYSGYGYPYGGVHTYGFPYGGYLG